MYFRLNFSEFRQIKTPTLSTLSAAKTTKRKKRGVVKVKYSAVITFWTYYNQKKKGKKISYHFWILSLCGSPLQEPRNANNAFLK